MKTNDYPMSPEVQRKISEEAHGTGKFDYSKLTILSNSKEKIELSCLSCGSTINVRWSSHVSGTGCRKCKNIEKGLKHRLGEEEIKNRISTKLPSVFNLESYKREGTRVFLECKKHGGSWLSLYSLLEGHNGCVGCTGGERTTKTKQKFIEESVSFFPNKFDYHSVNYVNNKTEVTLYCIEHSLYFNITPFQHLNSKYGGCPHCKVNEVLTTEEFVARSRDRFPGRFTYEKTEYRGLHTKLVITCLEHGGIECIPSNHLVSLTGCFYCGLKERQNTRTYSKEQYITIFESVHANKYDYSNMVIEGALAKDIICRVHGKFTQYKNDHSDGHGCPSCGMSSSAGEREVLEFVSSIVPGVESRNRKILDGREIDIFIPDLKIGIEYNGLFSHSEERGKDYKYHSNKTMECESKGIFLIQIFEDEWVNHKDILKRTLLTKLGKSTERSYSARSLLTREVPFKESNEFLDQNHLQGRSSAPSVSLGLYSKDTLTALMCFTIFNEISEAHLTRYCTAGKVRGGFGKLLTFFRRSNPGLDIVSFSDNRWSDGGVYIKNGFILESEVPPTYYWCYKQIRSHRRGFQKQYLQEKLGSKFNPELTEDENCRNAGYFKVWDCGKKKWRLR